MCLKRRNQWLNFFYPSFLFVIYRLYQDQKILKPHKMAQSGKEKVVTSGEVTATNHSLIHKIIVKKIVVVYVILKLLTKIM